MSPPKPAFARKLVLRKIGIGILIAIAVGAGFGWHQFRNRALSVSETRQLIRRYLESKAGVSRFDPLAMGAVVADVSGSNSNRPPDEETISKKGEKKKKNKTYSPSEQWARDFRRSIKESPDYKTTYRLLGENLARVDELLAAPEREEAEAALLLAVAASRAALDPAVDGWLAARVAEAYLWPNLDKAPATDKGGVDAASLLDVCENAFDAADETDNLIRNYRLLIARRDHPSKTDKYRVRLAKLLEGQQNFAEALQVLHQVQDTNNPTLARRISGVEVMQRQARASR